MLLYFLSLIYKKVIIMATYISERDLGETVYLVTDPDQNKYLITGIKFGSGGGILYALSFASFPEIYVTNIEISSNKNYDF